MELFSLPLLQFLLGAVFLDGKGGVLLSLTIAEQIVAFDVLISGIHLRITDIAEAFTGFARSSSHSWPS